MADFERGQCANCPYKHKYGVKIHKKKCVARMTGKSYRRAQQLKYMKSEKFGNYSRLRNGTETVPSGLRRNYCADRIPVRGLLRSRLVLGIQVSAMNVAKLLTHRRQKGN